MDEVDGGGDNVERGKMGRNTRMEGETGPGYKSTTGRVKVPSL